ncbi:MAG: bifunctional DNA primase/polymerase [Aggregatilineales bacterium]
MLKTNETGAQIYYQAALAYLDLGWSVIPLWGDAVPSRAKTPAVAWFQYQRAAADADTVHKWFLEDGFQAIGVVCGAVSGLVVLDFDDPALAETFARLYPDLANTLTVRSGGRGLPHYYFDLPQDVTARTLHAPGVDLLADGAYVVAPPTNVAGSAWEIVHDAPLRRLTARDAQRIAAFVAARQLGDSAQAVAPPTDLLFVDVSSGELSPDAMRCWYRRLAREQGRNCALFRVACFLRDSGWTQAETTAVLLDAHVVEPPARPHALETLQQRQREGRATIASAYRRPARPRVVAQRPANPDRLLPNSVRERLLQLGHAAAARVLEGLRAAGILAGQIFTEREATFLLRAAGIGRRAVLAALRTLLPSGEPLIPSLESRRRGRRINKRQKKCFFVRDAKRVKISCSQKRGRPATHFVMPDNGALYRALGVRPSGAEPLPAESLTSPRRYRAALHRALIARRPGRYSRRWLSARLGVSVWTSRRYDRIAGVVATPTYAEQPIYWGNLALVPPEADPNGPNGTFLVDITGKRYPPLQAIAMRLLARGQRVSLMRQDWNFYTVKFKHAEVQAQPAKEAAATVNPPAPAAVSQGPPPAGPASASATQSPACAPSTTAPADAPQPRAPECYLWLCPECLRLRLSETQPQACRCDRHRGWERYPEALWRDNARLTLWWRARCRRFREEQRARRQAQHLGTAAPAAQPASPIEAIDRMRQVLAAQHSEWLERLRRSPYAQYFANAHQFLGPPEEAPNA